MLAQKIAYNNALVSRSCKPAPRAIDLKFVDGVLRPEAGFNFLMLECVDHFNAKLADLRAEFGAVVVEAFVRSKPLDKNHQPLQIWKGVRVQVFGDRRGLRMSGTLNGKPFRLIVRGRKEKPGVSVIAKECRL